MTVRPTPYATAIAPWADEHFFPIRQALADLGVDLWDRDAFLMAQPVVALVHALRPEGGLGEGLKEFTGLLHAAYLFWLHGEPVLAFDARAAETLLAMPKAVRQDAGPSVRYVQLPPRRIWGAPTAGGPHEPLDGCFVIRRGDHLTALGIFGAHPDRDGFTVVLVEGSRPMGLAREDGAPLFAPVMEGGASAELHSLVGMEELLELAWRAEAHAGSVA